MNNQTKVLKLRGEIKDLEDQRAFFNSAISLAIDEQNRLDLEIEEYTNRADEVTSKLLDLRAELADTV